MKVSECDLYEIILSNIFVISFKSVCWIPWMLPSVWGGLEQACEEDLNIFNSSPVMGDMKPESETVEWCRALFWTPMIKSADIYVFMQYEFKTFLPSIKSD